LKTAAEKKPSVSNEAFVMPKTIGSYWLFYFAWERSIFRLTDSAHSKSVISPAKLVVPGFVIRTFDVIC
jgi:hypothetical protein